VVPFPETVPHFGVSVQGFTPLAGRGSHRSRERPEAISRTKALLPEVIYHDDPYEALKGADAALVFTESDIFRTLNWERAKPLMARGLVIDGRNLYSPQKMRELASNIILLAASSAGDDECPDWSPGGRRLRPTLRSKSPPLLLETKIQFR